MAGSINVNQNNNNVNIQDQNGRLTITDNNRGTTTNVTQPVTNIVTVATIGPQGPQGPQGPIGPIPTSGSFTGAFTGSFSGSVAAPGSNTQVVYNNGGVLGANSGFVYDGNGRINLEASAGPSYATFQRTGGGAATIGADSDTNAYLQSSTNIKFIPGGSYIPKMFISSSGNVGIGTDTPSASLHVKGAGTTNDTLGLNVTDNNNKSSLFVQDNGYVGINRNPSLPALKAWWNLHVSGTIASNNYVIGDAMYVNTAVSPITNGYPMLFKFSQSAVGYDNVDFQIQGNTNLSFISPVAGWTPLFTVKYNSKVGIGVNNTQPFAQLHVKSAGATSTTTAFQVDNYDGFSAFKVKDNGAVENGVFFGGGASGGFSHAEGYGTSAVGELSHAEGTSTLASGSYSHAEGQNTTTTGNYSHAEGTDTFANGASSHAEGYTTIANGYASHTEGRETQTIGDYSHAEGYQTITSGSYSHAEGFGTLSSGSYSHAEGNSAYAYGNFSHAEGDGTSAIGNGSHTEGLQTQTIGEYSHAEGQSSIAFGFASHAEGLSTQTIGEFSHAEGSQTITYGVTSHTEGYQTITSGSYSHAEGGSTQAIGERSHAEGDSTQTFGPGSHAEGLSTQTIGESSHAEGQQTIAFGFASHAEGLTTQTIGDYSHTEGLGTITDGAYQHAQGKYNISTLDEAAFIVGNGTDDSNRSNLIYAAGNQVQINGTSSIYGNLNITGNLNVLGTASFTSVTSSIVNVGASTITLNTDLPAVRFGGINVVDSGSFGNSSTGSLLWDSQNNRWIYSNPSGSTYDGGLLISGPRNTTGLGNEVGTTLNAIMKGQGGDHITSSAMFEVSGSVGISLSTPSASLHISGASSAALLQVDSPSLNNILFVTGSGRVGIGTNAPLVTLDISGSAKISNILYFDTSLLNAIYPTNDSFNPTINGQSLRFQSNTLSTARYGYNFINATGNRTWTSSTGGDIFLRSVYSPSSGNGVFNSFLLEFTINQTGGANGITRGLYIQPILTSSADFRAIESTNGKVVLTDTYSASGSLSGSLLDLSQTWNTPGVVTGIKYNVTNTTSSANSLLMDLQVGGTSRFRAINNGSVISLLAYYVGPQITSTAGISAFNPRTNTSTLTSNFNVGVRLGDFRDILSEGYSYLISSPQYTDLTYTGSIGGFVTIARGYAPTSGTGVFNVLSLENTINQTGGANGITRGLYVNPTLTSAADFRALENSRGNNFLNSTSGNTYVGLSTNTGTSRLQVRGSGATSSTTALRVENTNASASLVVLDNGYVGIGTGSAQYQLDVYGNYHQYQAQGELARYEISTANANQNRGVWSFFTNAAAAPDFFGRFGFKFEGGTADSFKQFQLHVADSTTPKFVVDGSGRVGIGTITPTASLHISGASSATLLLVDSPASSNILFVSGSGNVGMGTSTPGQQLTVMGNATFGANTPSAAARLLTRGAGTTSTSTSFRAENASQQTALRITDDLSARFDGKVGIGSGNFPTASLDVAGTTRISGSFNTAISGSILTVQGSGSAQPIFTVQGSQGELFSITDSLSGSLFSVNDISGLPILEVFSDNTTLIGNYQDPMLITTAKVVQTNSGSFTLYSLPTASYDTAFFEYSVRSGSNARAGTIMAMQLGSAVNFTETTTTDFGSTSAVSFTVIVTGSNMALTGSSTTGSWTIKTIVRGL